MNQMNRQSSLELAWQDLVNMLDDLPQNQAPLANQTQPDNRGRCSIESHYHKTENLQCKNFGKSGGLVVIAFRLRITGCVFEQDMLPIVVINT